MRKLLLVLLVLGAGCDDETTPAEERGADPDPVDEACDVLCEYELRCYPETAGTLEECLSSCSTDYHRPCVEASFVSRMECFAAGEGCDLNSSCPGLRPDCSLDGCGPDDGC